MTPPMHPRRKHSRCHAIVIKPRYARRMRDLGTTDTSLNAPIAFEGIGKRFAGTAVLHDVALNVMPQETVALLGPSGCGKTTLLRIAAGLITPCSGSVRIAGKVVANGAGVSLPPEARGLGMVFQDYALWPHLSVLANTAFPLRMRGIARAERERGAMAALKRVGLDHLAQRFPGTLSGGQQQRVALARAVVAAPPLVLFDEPLSNLDRELRESLALEMRGLLRDLGLSAVYVTHDQSEAFTIADRVAVMLGGRIAQIDTPERLFEHPASAEVAQFLNIGALLDGVITDGVFRSASQHVSCAAAGMPDGHARLLVPRTALRPDPSGPLMARVLRCQFQGDRYLLHLDLGRTGQGLVCPAMAPAAPDTEIALSLQTERLRLFPTAV